MMNHQPIAPRTFGLIAAAMTAATSTFELIRVLANHGAAHGIAPAWSYTGALLYATVMAIAAVGLAIHRQLGWVAGSVGVITALTYGVVLRAGGNWVGVLYMGVAAAIFPLLVKSMPYYRTWP